jgi:hypothetical protein
MIGVCTMYGKPENACRVLVVNLKGKGYFEDVGLDMRII